MAASSLHASTHELRHPDLRAGRGHGWGFSPVVGPGLPVGGAASARRGVCQ